MKTLSMDLINSAVHSIIEKHGIYGDEYNSEDEDDCYNDDEDNESSESSVMDEKAYVCDYDTVYVCFYEELEEYRTSKQTKKKNTTNSWNNLLVVLPTGRITPMKNAPDVLAKGVKKLMGDQRSDTKIESVKIEQKIEQSTKQETIPVTTNNSNSVTHVYIPEVKALKSEPQPSGKQKLSKKKLKKQRQKEKRNVEKKGNRKEAEKEKEKENGEEIVEDPKEEEPEEFTNEDKSRSESKTESVESMLDDIDDHESEDGNEASANIDLSSEIPAFVSNALKKNEKKNLIKKEEKLKSRGSKPKEIPTMVSASASASASVQQPNVDLEFDFTVKKIKRPKPTGNECLDAIALGKEAYKLIMTDRISQAVQLLSEAINMNNYDLRHFLNRSFCYLRLGAYNLALRDAQVVIKYTKERDEIVKAKFRAGQALCGLQNFEEAGKYLDEAYNFSQGDPHIHRELMRVRILQLLHMGFREKDVLEAFKESLSISEVVTILTEKTIVDEDDDCSYGSECDEDDIYNSDDEENPSFTRMLSNVLNYQPGFLKKLPNMPSSSSNIATWIPQTQTGFYRKPVAAEVKRIITTVPPKPLIANKGSVNDKAIWVGNTTPEVTDNMLRKKFSRFGKIVSMYRRPNESYTFINFESAKTVTELLSSTSFVELEGHKLPVKAATRTK